MVTYGGMSRRPVQVPTGKFIFNDLIYRGFWLTRWVNTHSKAERQTMIDELSVSKRTCVYTKNLHLP